MRQRLFVANALVLACILVSFPLWVPSKKEPKKLFSGAFRSMISRAEARSYPAEGVPGDGLMNGFRQMNRPAMKMKNDNTSPWRAMGPTNRSGRTLALEVDPVDPDLVYAGAASGGLWRSETGGEGNLAWERIETGWPVQGVAAIAVQPDDRDVVYIGTGEVYGYRTAFPGVGDRITRGSYGIGILKSEDRGKTWQLSLDWQNHQERGVQDILIDPRQTNRVFAATTEGVYLSEDSGDTWTRVLETIMATSLGVMDNGNLIVACGGFASPGHGLYRSTDNGITWDKLSGGLPETFGGKAILDVSPAETGVIYVSIGDSYRVDREARSWAYRSEDYGVTWTRITPEDLDFAIYQGWYGHFIKADPGNPDHLYLAGVVMFESFDRGRTWIQYEDYLIIDSHAMTFGQDMARYVGFDQGMAKFEEGDAEWQIINSGYQTLQFYNGMAQSPLRSNMLIGAPQDHSGSPYYSGRLNWNRYREGHEGSYTLIDPRDDSVRYFIQPAFELFQRQGLDSPISSNPPPDIPPGAPFNFVSPSVLAPSSPDTLYIGRHDVLRSDNQGDSWRVLNNGRPLDANPIMVMGISSQNEERVYVATAPRNAPFSAYRTDDGGDTWESINAGLPERYPSDFIVDPVDDQIAYLTFSGFGSSHVFKTIDSGRTWTDIDRGRLPDIPTSALAIDPANRDILYVGNDLGVFITYDGGDNWFNWSRGLPGATMVSDLLIYNPERLIRVGTHGNGAYERDLLEPPSDPTSFAWQYVLPETAGAGQGYAGLVNITDQTATIRLTGTDAAGNEIAVRDMELGSLARSYRATTDWFDGNVHQIRVQSDRELAVYAQMAGASTLTAYTAVQPGYLNRIPHVARDTAQFETILAAANNFGDGYGAQLKHYPAERGVPMDDLNNSGSRISADMRQYLGNDLSNVAWAELLSGSQPMAAMEYFTRLPARNETASIPLGGAGANRLLFLHIAENTALFWTGMVYINPGNDPAAVTEYHYDSQGNLLGSYNLSLASSQKETVLFDSSTVSGSTRIFEGVSWIEVQADRPLMGYQLFGAPLQTPHDIFAGLTAGDDAGLRLDYPHIRSGEGQWTGIVGVNTGEETADLQFTLYNDQGQELARQTVADVAPKAKVVRLVTELFPNAGNGTWIRAEATGSLWSGYQLWGDVGEIRHLMSGLEALVR